MSTKLAKRVPRPKRPSEATLNRRLIWKAGNFGVLSEVASLAQKSNVYVGQILRGERTNAIVERLLAERGAPGFESPAKEKVSEHFNLFR